MNCRILFVDDEPNVLDGIRRMMRSMSHEWEMYFSKNGQEALDVLDTKIFDVIVTDMRMPNMDGAELLNIVSKRYPQIIRIVLSGQANKESILRSTGITHQYLSKPCDMETLKSRILHVCILSESLLGSRLKQIISKIESLPSLPYFYQKLLDEIQSPNASPKTIGQIISRDIGMTTKILQIVNSNILGSHQNICNPIQAVIFLGLETIRSLVFSNKTFFSLDDSILKRLPLEKLWRHSAVTGEFAKQIAIYENIGQEMSDNAQVAGLLHDVGKLVLAWSLPDEYQSNIALSSQKGIKLTETESAIFGATHEKIGAYLLGLWGVPDPIIIAVASHHSPEKNQEIEFSLSAAVYAANIFAHEAYSDGSVEDLPQTNITGVNETEHTNKLQFWKEICRGMAQEDKDNA